MQKKLFSTLAIAALGLASITLAQAPTSQPASKEPVKHVTDSGLTIIEVGHEDLTSTTAQPGDYVWVEYTGKLQDGTKFDSSADHPEQPLVFPLGRGQVIRGWDEGIQGMKVGDKRQLVIPPALAYGSRATGPIPANSTLYFDVQLLGLKKGK